MEKLILRVFMKRAELRAVNIFLVASGEKVFNKSSRLTIDGLAGMNDNNKIFVSVNTTFNNVPLRCTSF